MASRRAFFQPGVFPRAPNQFYGSGKDTMNIMLCGNAQPRDLMQILYYLAPNAGRKGPKQTLHFTLVDGSPVTFARALVLMQLMFRANFSRAGGVKDSRMAGLVYAYMSPIIPGWASKYVEDAIGETVKNLESGRPVLNNIFLAKADREPILRHLRA